MTASELPDDIHAALLKCAKSWLLNNYVGGYKRLQPWSDHYAHLTTIQSYNLPGDGRSNLRRLANDWLKTPRAPDYPERDTLKNMNPACPPCNTDKHSYSLESWRQIIQRSNEVLQRDVSTFRRAVRYQLVSLSSEPVVFYFEKHALKENT